MWRLFLILLVFVITLNPTAISLAQRNAQALVSKSNAGWRNGKMR